LNIAQSDSITPYPFFLQRIRIGISLKDSLHDLSRLHAITDRGSFWGYPVKRLDKRRFGT
ncbi:MAG: hypothetical protein LBM09_00415, partial [Candidatus Nomurabacteria bacterium]|nr:hypothetical protein [Candidatus Nomurabacteria bacterium]